MISQFSWQWKKFFFLKYNVLTLKVQIIFFPLKPRINFQIIPEFMNLFKSKARSQQLCILTVSRRDSCLGCEQSAHFWEFHMQRVLWLQLQAFHKLGTATECKLMRKLYKTRNQKQINWKRNTKHTSSAFRIKKSTLVASYQNPVVIVEFNREIIKWKIHLKIIVLIFFKSFNFDPYIQFGRKSLIRHRNIRLFLKFLELHPFCKEIIWMKFVNFIIFSAFTHFQTQLCRSETDSQQELSNSRLCTSYQLRRKTEGCTEDTRHLRKVAHCWLEDGDKPMDTYCFRSDIDRKLSQEI